MTPRDPSRLIPNPIFIVTIHVAHPIPPQHPFHNVQFYGPKDFHPDTTYEDLLNTPPELSSSPIVENQSLYWVSANWARDHDEVDKCMPFCSQISLYALKLLHFSIPPFTKWSIMQMGHKCLHEPGTWKQALTTVGTTASSPGPRPSLLDSA